MILQPPIIITGIPRSGTSMTCGIIQSCGAFGGDTSPPNRSNQKGMFENTHVRNNILKPYLKRCGADPLGQYPLPDVLKLKPFPTLRKEIEDTFLSQGYAGGPWYYKGLKACLVWPTWLAAFPDAKWVIIRRNDEQIIQSCLRAPFMRAYRDAKGWQSWLDHHKNCLNQLKKATECFEFWSESVFEDLDDIKQLIEYLDLDWNEQAVKEFIDPSLYSRSTA